MYELFQKQFTTGEYASMYNINKRTLMYYDSIDLFKPAVVKKNGYRYYTLSQSAVFEAIQILSKLHIPLAEIKQYLTNCTPQTLQTLLHKQSQMLEQEIAELSWLQQIVHNKINSMEANRNIDYNTIDVIEVNKQTIIISESLAEKPFEEAVKRMFVFMRECYRSWIYKGYPGGYMLDAEKVQQGDFSQLIHQFYRIDELGNEPLQYSCMPAGRYLVSFHKGTWLQIPSTLQKLANYANDNSLTLIGYAYLESILDETVSAANPDYCEVRISILLK